MEQVAGEALTLDPYAYSITMSGTLSVEIGHLRSNHL